MIASFLRAYSKKSQSGFGLVEIIVAVSILTIFISGSVFLMSEDAQSTLNNSDWAQARALAQEGLDALNSISNGDWCSVSTAMTGLVSDASGWHMSYEPETIGKFTRSTTIQIVYRDIDSQKIVGTAQLANSLPDYDTKQITVDITWPSLTGQALQYNLTGYISNYSKTRKGMLTFVDGANRLRYRLYDDASKTWTPSLSDDPIDIPASSSGFQYMKLYSSPKRDEKILILQRAFTSTVHCPRPKPCPKGQICPICIPGTTSTDYVDALIFDGCTNQWSPQNLFSDTASYAAFDGTRKFDGGYLADGSFMLYYVGTGSASYAFKGTGESDGFEVAPIDSAGAVTNYQDTVAQAQPRGMSMLTASLTLDKKTYTDYFGNGAWQTEQYNQTASDYAQYRIDLTWNTSDTTKAAFAYHETTGQNPKKIGLKVWTDNMDGTGSWSSQVLSNPAAQNLGPVRIVSRPDAAEFMTCSQEIDAPQPIYCFTANATPAWQSVTNTTIAASSIPGPMPRFDMAFVNNAANKALVVYSDGTAVPKAKKYTSYAWDASPTTLPSLSAIFESVHMAAQPNSNDIMIIMADALTQLSSIMWNGNTNSFYNSGGQGLNAQVAAYSGYSGDLYWYDFAWDQF